MTETRPDEIVVELLSDTTFGRGEPTAGEVDMEVEHDDLGLPFLGARRCTGCSGTPGWRWRTTSRSWTTPPVAC